MNTVTRFMNSVRSRTAGRDQNLEMFYGTIARKSQGGTPHFDETRRDYKVMREQLDRMGMLF